MVYVPVNIKGGFNLTPVNQKFSWYHGADLLTVLAENQQRNYYDEDIWSRLVHSPLNFPMISAMRVSGIGTVAGGIALSKSGHGTTLDLTRFDRWHCAVPRRLADFSFDEISH